MSAGALGNPLAPIRDTVYYDRATGRLPANRRPGASNDLTPLPAGGGDANPYLNINAENAAKSAAGTYAGSQFEKWFGGLSDQEKQQFNKPTGTGTFKADLGPPIGATGQGVSTYKIANETGPQDPAVAIEGNARQHFMQHILPNDPEYARLQGNAATATQARATMTPLPQVQAQQAALAQFQATTDSVAANTDRTRSMTPILATAGNLANTATGQANDRYAAMTPILQQQEQNKVAAGGIANTQAQQMIAPNVAKTQAQAALTNRQADADFVPRAEHEKLMQRFQDQQQKFAQLEIRLAQLENPGKAAPGPAAPPGAQQANNPAPAAPQQPAPAVTPVSAPAAPAMPAAAAPAAAPPDGNPAMVANADGTFSHKNYPGVKYRFNGTAYSRVQ